MEFTISNDSPQRETKRNFLLWVCFSFNWKVLFNYNLFQELGGNWCIGSDSNVGLNPFEEIRLLDYTNRLKTNNRDTFKNSKSANSGEIAFQAIYKNGHKAMGDKKSDYFEIGGTMDFLDIDKTKNAKIKRNHQAVYTANKPKPLNSSAQKGPN